MTFGLRLFLLATILLLIRNDGLIPHYVFPVSIVEALKEVVPAVFKRSWRRLRRPSGRMTRMLAFYSVKLYSGTFLIVFPIYRLVRYHTVAQRLLF